MRALHGLFLFGSLLAMSAYPAGSVRADWDFNLEMPDLPSPVGVYEYVEESLFGEEEKVRRSDFDVAKEKSPEEIKKIRNAKSIPMKKAASAATSVTGQTPAKSVLMISSDYFVPSEMREAPLALQPALLGGEDIQGGGTSVTFEPVRLGNDFSDPSSLNEMEPTAGPVLMTIPSQPLLAEPVYEAEPEAEVETETASYAPVRSGRPQHVSFSPSEINNPVHFRTTGKPHRYRALRGANLAEVLDVWAEDAGIEMVWLAGRNFSVINSVSTKSTFEEAVVEVLEQYNNTRGERPVAQLNTDPQTLQKTLIIRTGRI